MSRRHPGVCDWHGAHLSDREVRDGVPMRSWSGPPAVIFGPSRGCDAPSETAGDQFTRMVDQVARFAIGIV
jgi:hypothetical protein